MDRVDNAAGQFTASELVLIAETFGLAPNSMMENRRLIDLLVSKIMISGIPSLDLSLESNQLVREFLYVLDFIDEKGDISPEKEALSLEQFCTKHNIDPKPRCFSYADDEDSKCKNCILYGYCASWRLLHLPPCFGLLYSNSSENCLECIDAPYCAMSIVSNT